MRTISFEYCHITPGVDVVNVIKESNFWAPKVLKALNGGGERIQKCIMVDDIHAKAPVTKKLVDSLIKKLVVKPDCVYLESDIAQFAEKLIRKINPDLRELVYSKNYLWLKEEVNNYIKYVSEFLIAWSDKNGKKKFACPLITASSYLIRLGEIRGIEKIKVAYGDKIKPADYCFNLLSSKYLETEDKTQSIIEAIDKKVLRQVLKTSAKGFYDVWLAKCMTGSALAGSMGFNAQFANIIAAIFLATGQDPAHVVEGSLGITSTEIIGENLYVSIYLPDLMVGTVGGGTGLATQKEALSILGIKGGRNGKSAERLAEIIAGSVLAGEISLLASLSEGSLVKAHNKLGRGKKL